MLLHEMPAIAAGLDRLTAAHPRFAAADRSRFRWEAREASFAGLLRMILGQQVSTAAAASMWTKLEAILPGPDPVRFLKLDDTTLAAAGFSRQKMRYGRTLAERLVSDPAFLDRLAIAPDEEAIVALSQLPGIGRWSAELYLMFCLGRPDIWPAGDLGIVLGVQYLLGLAEKPKAAEIIAVAEPWKPYRSAAALLVWDHYMEVAVARRREQRAAGKGSQG